jgi:hypothetical protein
MTFETHNREDRLKHIKAGRASGRTKRKGRYEERMENWGHQPDYFTKTGNPLFIQKGYDAYSSASHSKRLLDKNGRFWGYSDSNKIKRNDSDKLYYP